MTFQLFCFTIKKVDQSTIWEEPFVKHYPATFLKYISILQRNTSRYFDMVLEPFGIGSGQQFFLRQIYENEGISMYDLAKIGCFDKGTVTKAVQKLEELGYVKILADEKDRRIKRLHITSAAQQVLEKVYQKRDLWKNSLTENIPPEKEKELEQLLEKMAQISCQELSAAAKQREEIHDRRRNTQP